MLTCRFVLKYSGEGTKEGVQKQAAAHNNNSCFVHLTSSKYVGFWFDWKGWLKAEILQKVSFASLDLARVENTLTAQETIHNHKTEGIIFVQCLLVALLWKVRVFIFWCWIILWDNIYYLINFFGIFSVRENKIHVFCFVWRLLSNVW